MATSIDTHELDIATARLRGVGERLRDEADDELGAGARRIQSGMKVDATGHRYLPKFPRHVGRSRISKLHWEIGFNRVGQGNLADIIVGGSINNAPVYPWLGPFEREIPVLEQRLADRAEKLVADCFG